MKYPITQGILVKNCLVPFCLPKKVPKKGPRNPRLTGRARIYSPIAGRSYNQHQFFGNIIFSNSTLRAESFNIFRNLNIFVRYFNSTTRCIVIICLSPQPLTARENSLVSFLPCSIFFQGQYAIFPPGYSCLH